MVVQIGHCLQRGHHLLVHHDAGGRSVSMGDVRNWQVQVLCEIHLQYLSDHRKTGYNVFLHSVNATERANTTYSLNCWRQIGDNHRPFCLLLKNVRMGKRENDASYLSRKLFSVIYT